MTEALYNKINLALDSIRGYLQSDGGDVRVHQLREDGVLEVELLGNCMVCSMSNMTLKAGIEEVIKRDVPEVKQVIAVEIPKN